MKFENDAVFSFLLLGNFGFLSGLWFIVIWDKAEDWKNPTVLHPLFAVSAFVFLSLSLFVVPFVGRKRIVHVFLHVLSFCTFVAPFVWFPRKEKAREELFLPLTFHSFLGFFVAIASMGYAGVKLISLPLSEKTKEKYFGFLFGIRHKQIGSALYFLVTICVVTGITERQDRGKETVRPLELVLLNASAICSLILGSFYLVKYHQTEIKTQDFYFL